MESMIDGPVDPGFFHQLNFLHNVYMKHVAKVSAIFVIDFLYIYF